jgi:ribosome recycling factor
MAADFAALKRDLQRRMDGAMETLKKEFAGLRTGRASPALLEPIRVEAYGNVQPLNQVANISIAGPGLLSVQVWDKSVVKTAAKYTEAARVAVRGVRRDGMETVKAWEKDKKAEASQDDVKRWSDEVQKMTDAHIKQVDTALVEKEKDIRTG